MTYSPMQAPQPSGGSAPARPNIYTALLLIAIIALLTAVIVVGMRLMSASPDGYGMSFGELFEKLPDLSKP